MGGFGSTRWAGISTKNTVEANLPLDINKLNRAGCLRPGFRGAWEWTRNGKPFASIQVCWRADHLVLLYAYQENAGDWRSLEQPRQLPGHRAGSGADDPISSARVLAAVGGTLASV